MKKENEIEKAYKEIKEQKIPDLWARIESEVEKEEKRTDREIVPESNTRRKQMSGISKSLKSRKIEAALCLVAGIIAVLVVVPIFFEHGKSYENAVIESTRDDKIESVESNTIGSDTMEGGTKENSKNTDNSTEESADESTDKPKVSLENKEMDKEEKNFLESDELSGHPQQISLEIEKEAALSTLDSIDFSEVSVSIVNQLKTLLENYDACELYKDQEGHLYVLKDGTLYVVRGTLLE